MSAVDKLLSRLDGVRRSNKGWAAKCPAHADRTASLSIAEGDDGRILVHCFAGCAAADVVAAAGMELADLFSERIRDTSPEDRAAARRAVTEREKADALAALLRASYVVQSAAAVVALWLFDDADRESLARAVELSGRRPRT